MSNFSTTLKQLRSQQGYTQESLAKALGVTKSRINMYERGEREPNFEMLKHIAEFFQVDMNYLLGHNDHTSTEGEKIMDENPDAAFVNARTKKIALLTRKVEEMPDSDREFLESLIENTIDTYLAKMKKEK